MDDGRTVAKIARATTVGVEADVAEGGARKDLE
jgi:hypothetical protein